VPSEVDRIYRHFQEVSNKKLGSVIHTLLHNFAIDLSHTGCRDSYAISNLKQADKQEIGNFVDESPIYGGLKPYTLVTFEASYPVFKRAFRGRCDREENS